MLRTSLQSTVFGLSLIFGVAGSAQASPITFFDFNDSNLTSDRGRTSTITTNFATTGTNFSTGTAVNSDPDDGGSETASTAGRSLGLTNQANNGRYIQFGIDTRGFQDINVDFATLRTANGFNNNIFQYSVNGTTFTNFGTYNSPIAISPSTAFATQVFDLSAIAGLDNNANAAFRIIFNGATASTGNNRIDNLTISGTQIATAPVPEPETYAMMGMGLLMMVAMLRKKKMQAMATSAA